MAAAEKRTGGAGRPPWVTVLAATCATVSIGVVASLVVDSRFDLRLWWLPPVACGLLGFIGSSRPTWGRPMARDKLVPFSALIGALIVVGVVITIGLETYWMWIWVALALAWFFLVLATVTDSREDQ